MKNKLVYLNIIFTALFLILSALFLIYIFREIRCKEYFEGDPYSWKYGEGNTCSGDLNTNTELRNRNSNFLTNQYNRFDNPTLYTRSNIRDTTHPYRKYCDVMSYKDLLAYRCLNKSPIKMQEVMDDQNVDIASTLDYIYIYNESSLYSYLLAKIQAQKNMLDGKKIVGPVYVCISQSPYLRYNSEYSNNNNSPYARFLDARIDILNNKNPYYLETISPTGVQSFVTETNDGKADPAIISSLYCHILIMYPLYDKTMTLKKEEKTEQVALITRFLEETMTRYYTDNELCFIKCNKSPTLNCGCLTRTAESPDTDLYTYNNSDLYNYNESDISQNEEDITRFNESRDMPLYTSKCIDHTQKNKVSDFTMMYYVNPYSDSYGDSNIIEDPEPEVAWAEKMKSFPIPAIITIPAPVEIKVEGQDTDEVSRPTPTLAF